MSSGEIQCEEQNIEKKFKVVFVLGPPGSGKGTICQIISPVRSFIFFTLFVYQLQCIFLRFSATHLRISLLVIFCEEK